MMGRSGGVGLLCDKAWWAESIDGPVLEAGASNAIVVRLHTTAEQDQMDVILYYGHPSAKLQTKRDTSSKG